ncbi:MAG: type II secretion system protein GspC [Proteobacteria bacterium]|nr:MAG: type II secretion system protein GspC [Pseudomonadota bacterium]
MAIAPPPPAAYDISAIQQGRLFGSAAPSPSGSAPATSAPLVLGGVMASEDGKKGYALIGTSGSATRVYAIGAALPGGLTLHEIYPDRVVLSRNGALETLALPRQPSTSSIVAPPPPTGANVAVAGGGATASAVDRISRIATENPGLIGQVMRAQPVLANGQQRGFRVFPAPNQTAAFARIGLRAGDLVTHINGTPLDDPQRGAEILSTLSSASEARVTVVRNGRQEDVALNLAEAARQAEALNAAPRPDGSQPQTPPP